MFHAGKRTVHRTGIVGVVNVTFYGVRGSCPCSGDRYRRYGGNTSCLLVEVEGDEPLILDLGTGLRALGDDLLTEVRALGAPLHATALLTHLHFDHILGLPFFGPLQDPGARLTLHGPAQPDGSLKDALHAAVQPPVFPIHMDEFRGEMIMIDTQDEDFSIGSAKVMARAIPHLGTTLGYRIEAEGRSLAYLPDHQAPLDRRTISDAVLELCHDVDLLLHDGQYTESEYLTKANWGHSTAAFAVHVAAESRAKKLVLTHHDPAHDDRLLDRILTQARHLPEAKGIGDVSSARESQSIDLGRA
jgi:phosphoribosyl 1,2-cyclic phosphodiesterase